jgi:hypothetical protein
VAEVRLRMQRQDYLRFLDSEQAFCEGIFSHHRPGGGFCLLLLSVGWKAMDCFHLNFFISQTFGRLGRFGCRGCSSDWGRSGMGICILALLA